MGVHLVTFGYDHGEPPSADCVYDVRGEKYNPREWARKAQEIADAAGEGETIAIGCKHGDTRSVRIAEDVKTRLGKGTTLTHLDKDKGDTMPLMEGDDPQVINENIRELRKSGRPESEAIAAAYRKAGKSKKRKKGKHVAKKMPMKG